MGRRKGMWITIIGILIVGVSVTKITRQFVTSEGAEAVAVMPDAGDTAVPEQEEEVSLSVQPQMRRATVFNGDAGIQREAEETAADAETVKSPLDPAVETETVKTAILESEETQSVYTPEDLESRLKEAGEKASQCRKGISESNPGSAYAMAEQERLIWDKELNIIYTAIRSCMTEDEAENLKRSELEWLKERDLAADKAASKNMLSQNQNPDSARVLAEKTKERCYELLRDYGDILNRTETAE